MPEANVAERFNVRLGPLVVTKIKDNEERVYYEGGGQQWLRLKGTDMLALQRKLIEFQLQLNDFAQALASGAAPAGAARPGGFPQK